MKWIAFAIFLSVGFPAMTAAGILSARARQFLFGLLVFTTVLKISVNFEFIEGYRGPDRGYEVHATEVVALALALGLVANHWQRIKWIPFNTIPMGIFFVLSCISALEPTATFHANFTIFKMAKCYLIYWVAYNAYRTEDQAHAIWWAVAAIFSIEFFFAFKQKYGEGLYRVNGTFDHSNTIPAYLLMLLPMMLAWAFNSERLALWQKLYSLFAVGCASFSILATMSRFGLVMMGFVIVATTMRIVPARPNRMNLALSSAMFLAMAAAAIVALDNYIDRFINAPKTSAEARDEFNVAAEIMARDVFFGVGINCFSEVLTREARFNGHIRVMAEEHSAGVCHHIYLLTAAELGNIGLAVFLLIIGRFFLVGLRQLLSLNTSLNRTLMLGLILGAFALHLIGLLEWVLRLTPVIHMYLITSAIIVALSEKIQLEDRERKIALTQMTLVPPTKLRAQRRSRASYA